MPDWTVAIFICHHLLFPLLLSRALFIIQSEAPPWETVFRWQWNYEKHSKASANLKRRSSKLSFLWLFIPTYTHTQLTVAKIHPRLRQFNIFYLVMLDSSADIKSHQRVWLSQIRSKRRENLFLNLCFRSLNATEKWRSEFFIFVI